MKLSLGRISIARLNSQGCQEGVSSDQGKRLVIYRHVCRSAMVRFCHSPRIIHGWISCAVLLRHKIVCILVRTIDVCTQQLYELEDNYLMTLWPERHHLTHLGTWLIMRIRQQNNSQYQRSSHHLIGMRAERTRSEQ